MFVASCVLRKNIPKPATMKIALIRKEYTLSWGGAEIYVVNLSRQLVEMGHEVHIFANTFDLPSDPGITFHKVSMLAFFSPLKNLTFALNTKRLLKKENFDITNGFSQVYHQDIYRNKWLAKISLSRSLSPPETGPVSGRSRAQRDCRNTGKSGLKGNLKVFSHRPTPTHTDRNCKFVWGSS